VTGYLGTNIATGRDSAGAFGCDAFPGFTGGVLVG
jgi:hypothetical protein